MRKNQQLQKKDFEIKKDILVYLLSKQHNLHQHADTKVYFIFGILGFIAWKIIPVLTKLTTDFINKLNLIIVVLIILLILILLISYVYALIMSFNASFPKIKSEKNTIVFFGIASTKTPEEVCTEILNSSDENLLKELAYDYNINSKISTSKFNATKQAFISAFISLFSFIFLYFISSLNI